MAELSIGERVMRKEDRPVRGATIAGIDNTDIEDQYLIAYDEGGEGWWPEGTLEAEA